MEVGYLTPNPLGGGLVEHFLLVLVKTGDEQGIAQVRPLFRVMLVLVILRKQLEHMATDLSIGKSDGLIKTMSTKVQRRSLANLLVTLDSFHNRQGDCA